MENKKKTSEYEEQMGMTYQEAVSYLKEIGEWEKYCDQDGYTIIATAKSIRDDLRLPSIYAHRRAGKKPAS